MRKKINKLIIILFFLIATSDNEIRAQQLDNKNKISIFSKNRLEGYIKGKFFSYVLNTKISNSSGIYFFLSEDGQYSTIAYCPDFSNDRCIKDHIKFRSKFRCERISQQRCKLIYIENKSVLKNFNENNFSESFLLIKNLDKIEKKLSSEIRAVTYQENSSEQDFNN